MEVKKENAVLVKGSPRRLLDWFSLNERSIVYPISVDYRDLHISITKREEADTFRNRLATNLEKLQLDYINNQLDDYHPGSNINIMYMIEKVEEGIHYLVQTQAVVKLKVNYDKIKNVDAKGRGLSSKKDEWSEENKKLIINVYNDDKHTLLKGRKMRFALTDIPDKIKILDLLHNPTTKKSLGIPKKAVTEPYVKPPVKDIYLNKIYRINYKGRE